MKKILFICHGNICRSTMAEFVMKDMLQKAGYAVGNLDDGIRRKKPDELNEYDFIVDSAATSREEIGNGVHRGTRKKLAAVGVPCGEHRARQVIKQDYHDYDLLIIMDEENAWGLRRIIPNDPDKKIHMMLEYTGENRDVADPWYTGNFDVTYDDISRGCEALLKQLNY